MYRKQSKLVKITYSIIIFLSLIRCDETTEPPVNSTYKLTLSSYGNGTCIANPLKEKYQEGENVSLTATAGTGWQFTKWTGSISDVNNPLTVNMMNDMTITGVFFPEWLKQECPVYWNWFDVEFVDANNGTMVGYIDNVFDGIIRRTTDGGVSWSFQSTGDIWYGNISFVDVNNGWAEGEDDIIIRTTDGGITWQRQNLGFPTNVSGIFFLDLNHGWVVGYQEDMVLRTTDGGTTWTKHISGISTGLNSVFFVDVNNGWVTGSGAKILRTTDGGATWSLQTSETNNQHLGELYFTDLNNGWVVGGGVDYFGSYGLLYGTNDGGITWTSRGSYTDKLTAVHFTDSNNGTVVGYGGRIFRTTNGGIDWILQPHKIPGGLGNLSGVTFTDTFNGWIVGENGAVLHTADGGNSFFEK